MATVVHAYPVHGTPSATAAPRKANGLGDRVERFVKPVAMALKLPCLESSGGGLKPESPCARHRDRLNELGAKVGI